MIWLLLLYALAVRRWSGRTDPHYPAKTAEIEGATTEPVGRSLLVTQPTGPIPRRVLAGGVAKGY
jgi:hypothetical protein